MKSKPWLATYRENGIPAEIDANACPSVVHRRMRACSRPVPDVPNW
jgi:hypothetical protein